MEFHHLVELRHLHFPLSRWSRSSRITIAISLLEPGAFHFLQVCLKAILAVGPPQTALLLPRCRVDHWQFGVLNCSLSLKLALSWDQGGEKNEAENVKTTATKKREGPWTTQAQNRETRRTQNRATHQRGSFHLNPTQPKPIATVR